MLGFRPIEAPTYDPRLIEQASKGGFTGALGSLAAGLVNEIEKGKLQAERDREIARQKVADERAAQQFEWAKQDRDKADAAKLAANEYQNKLNSALSGGVIGAQDQATVGNYAVELARKGITGTEAESAMNEYLRKARPVMETAYKESPAAQLEVLRGVTGLSSMDPTARMNILKTIEQPLEKADDRNFAAKLQEEVEKRRMANERKLLGERAAQELSLFEKKQDIENKNKVWIDPNTNKPVPAGTEGAIDINSFSKLWEIANKGQKPMYGAVYDNGTWRPATTSDTNVIQLEGKDYAKLLGSSGTDSGAGKGSKLYNAKDYSETLAKIDSQYFASDKSTALKNADKARTDLRNMGADERIIDHILTEALQISKNTPGVLRGSFDPETFNTIVDSNVKALINGQYDKVVKNPIDKDKAAAYLKAQLSGNGANTDGVLGTTTPQENSSVISKAVPGTGIGGTTLEEQRRRNIDEQVRQLLRNQPLSSSPTLSPQYKRSLLNILHNLPPQDRPYFETKYEDLLKLARM